MSKVRPAQVVFRQNAHAFRALETARHDLEEAERARESVLDLMAGASGLGCIRVTGHILADLNRQVAWASKRVHKAKRRLQRTADMNVAPYSGSAKPAIERIFRDMLTAWGLPDVIDTGAAQ